MTDPMSKLSEFSEYRDEVMDQLNQLNNELLVSEPESFNSEKINRVYRSVHTMKGASMLAAIVVKAS